MRRFHRLQCSTPTTARYLVGSLFFALVLASAASGQSRRFEVTGATVPEGGNSGVSLLQIQVTMFADPRPTSAVTVEVTGIDVTAQQGLDYSLPANATVTFLPGGPTVQTLDIDILGDPIVEGDETFDLQLLDSGGAILAGARSTVEIIDDDFLTVSVADRSLLEGNTSRAETLTVSFSNPVAVPVTVQAAASDGTAVAGQDYAVAGLSVTVAAGVQSGDLDFTVLGDLIDESDESFFIDLTSTTTGSFGQGRSEITLIDDDDLTISITDQSFAEGNVIRSESIAISLSGPAAVPVTVQAIAVDGTATTGVDYDASGLSVTVPAGALSASFDFTVLGDLVDEPDETFEVQLTSTTLGSFGTSQAQMTLIDDDSQPGLSVSDLSLIEGDSGSLTGNVQITLSLPSAATVRARLDSADVTATAGSDYQALSSVPVVFAPGETAVTVPVSVAGDVALEGDETFTLILSQPQNAGLADPQGVVTIVDDDALISLADSVVDATEGGGDLDLVITRTGDLSQRLDLDVSFSAGVAQEGVDYVPTASQTTFLPGDTRKSIPLLVIDDALIESPVEQFTATVTTAAASKDFPIDSATLGVPQSLVFRIRDNDQASVPTVRFNRLRRQAYEDEGSVELFVERTGDTSGSASVEVVVSGGSASQGVDYSFATQRVQWAPGDGQPKSVSVGLVDDNVTEGTEQAIFQLRDPQSTGGPAPLAIGSPSATVLEILERSSAAFVRSVLFVTEGSTDVPLDVRRLGNTSSALSLEVCIDGGTSSSSDRTVSGRNLSWSANDTRIQGAVLDVPDDDISEPRETLFLSLCNPSTGSVASSMTVFILDDDLPMQPVEPLGNPGDGPENPAVAYGRGGQRVEVWQQSDGSGFGVWARFIDSLGEPVGPDVLVNTTIAGDQTEPDVAIDYDGNVTIVWRDGPVTPESPKTAARANGSAVVGRFFAPNGDAKTTEVIVSESDADESNSPNVSASNTGDAVVTWESDDQVQGRIYAKSTLPRTNILPISDLDEGLAATPRSTVGASGDFIVAWREEPSTGNVASRVVTQIFDENGEAKSAKQTVTAVQTAQFPVVASDDDGDFVVAWEQEDATTGWDVMARSYDRSAAALGTEFLVSESADGSQRRPAIDRNAIGDFVIVWELETAGAKATGGSLVGRFFAPTGAPVSGEVEVATTESGSEPVDADVSIADRDQTTVVFEREGPGGEKEGIFSVTIDPLPSGEPCVGSATVSCLNQGRFSVDARWQDFDLENGDGQVEVLTDDTSYFWFFDAANVEVVVKVLDACAVNGHYWVFAAGLTDTEVNLRVDDSASGETVTIFNPLGRGFQPVLDTRAFETCDVTAPRPDESRAAALQRIAAEIAGTSSVIGGRSLTDCVADEEQMCLNGGRFGASIDWSTNQGTAGSGQQVTLTTDTGYFWFFEPDNVEVVVKVLDACAINGKYWVFAAGLTDVETDLQVVDSVSGAARSYASEEGQAFSVVLDTGFFDCE